MLDVGSVRQAAIASLVDQMFEGNPRQDAEFLRFRRAIRKSILISAPERHRSIITPTLPGQSLVQIAGRKQRGLRLSEHRAVHPHRKHLEDIRAVQRRSRSALQGMVRRFTAKVLDNRPRPECWGWQMNAPHRGRETSTTFSGLDGTISYNQ